MKKLIHIFLFVIIVFMLVGCDYIKGIKDNMYPEPTGLFDIKFIDKENCIYDLPEDTACIPSTVFTFHAYPIMDADLAMYVNGEKKCIQKNVFTDDGYIWEYTFEMIPDSVTIEFKIEESQNHFEDDIEAVLILPLFSSGMIYGKVGESIQLSYVVIPNDATYNNVSWSSSDESIATITNDGLVSFVKEGGAIISLTIDDVTATIPIKITENKNDEYNITVIDDYDIVLNLQDLINVSFKEGDNVTVKLRFFSGPSVGILVDGEKVRHNKQSGTDAQIHEFTMPAHDVVIKTTYNNLVSSGQTDIEKKLKHENDYFFPSTGSKLHKDRFNRSFIEALGDNINDIDYEILLNYVPEEKSELYNFDAFTIRMGNDIYFYLWFNGKIYLLSNIPCNLDDNYSFLHFCVSDINQDGFIEISVSTNFNRATPNTICYTFVSIIDEYSTNLVDYNTIHDAYAYFKEVDGVFGIYISDSYINNNGSYEDSNTLYSKLIPNDTTLIFKKKEYYCSTENFEATITIDETTSYFPILSDGAKIGFSVNVAMTYLGESFSYVSPTGYLAGATCVFDSGDDRIICEGWGEPCVVTTFEVNQGMKISRTYYYPYSLSYSFIKGTYDMIISYRGENIIIEDFLIIK